MKELLGVAVLCMAALIAPGCGESRDSKEQLATANLGRIEVAPILRALSFQVKLKGRNIWLSGEDLQLDVAALEKLPFSQDLRVVTSATKQAFFAAAESGCVWIWIGRFDSQNFSHSRRGSEVRCVEVSQDGNIEAVGTGEYSGNHIYDFTQDRVRSTVSRGDEA